MHPFELLIVAILVVGLIGVYLAYAQLQGVVSAQRAGISSMRHNLSVLSSEYQDSLSNASTLKTNSTAGGVVFYRNETISIPAPQYNYEGYNYVSGCYYIGGAVNLSFYAPYPGYLVFTESNSGLKNVQTPAANNAGEKSNFTNPYFSVDVSAQEPVYESVEPYNGTRCPGWSMSPTAAAVTTSEPANNQSVIIPVQKGLNYMLFNNFNADERNGIAPQAINVTFSLSYYGLSS